MKVVSLDFEKPVWRVMPDHGETGLAIEVRSREEKEVQFFYVNLTSGKHIQLQTENDWWQGLKEVKNGIVVLHGYESPGLPLPKGVFAYDGEHGAFLWKKPEETFVALARDIISLKDQQGQQTYVSLSSGETVSKLPDPSIFTREAALIDKNLSFPKVFIDGHEEFSTLHVEIKQYWQADPQVQIDLFQGKGKMGDYRIFNFYDKHPSGSWNQALGVLAQNKPTLHRQIGTNLKGLSLDPFFIFQDYLIWIENATRLSYLRLG